MLSRMVFILLMFCIILVVSKSSKNRIDGLLRTIADAGMIGKKFYVKPKRKSAKQKSKICKLPHDVGPCRDAKQRFYYDSITNECKVFTYGGCRGNKNNFRSLDKCQKRCKV